VLRQARDARLGNWSAATDGPLDALRGIFLTHLHSDHVVDLNNILTEGLYNGLHRTDGKSPSGARATGARPRCSARRRPRRWSRRTTRPRARGRWSSCS